MFRFLRYNSEGFANLFTYNFHQKVYVLHGDYKNNFINGLYNDVSKHQGGVYFKDKLIEDPREFAKNEAGVIFAKSNFIPYLTFEQNLKFVRKVKKEVDKNNFTARQVFDLLELDTKYLKMNVDDSDYLLEKKLAVAKSLLANDELIFIVLSTNDEHYQENVELIEKIREINVKIKRIFVISDIKRHYESGDVVFLKYFQGFISEKMMEAE